MKTLDILDIARDLECAAKYYLEDACADRLGGQLRMWFDEALKQHGMQDVMEIVKPAPVFIDSVTGDGTMTTVVGGTRYTITRGHTATFVDDIDAIRVNWGKFLSAVQEAVAEYVRNLPDGTTVATVPTLYVCTRAYVVEWFLWGYAGVPNDEALRR